MCKQEIDLIRDLCHQVDCLVTSDQGNSDLDVLETYRLKMNDLLWQKKYRQAENMAYAILMLHAGQSGEDYLSAVGY